MSMSYLSDLETLAAAQIEAQRLLFADLPSADLQRIAATGRPWRARAMMAAAAMLRAERGDLDLKSRLDLANVFSSLGRHDEVLDVLGPPSAEMADKTLYWVKRAEGLAGVGRFAEAVQAAAVFASLSKPLKHEPIWRRLAETQAAPPTTWAAIAAFAAEVLSLGARRAAGEAIAPLLTRTDIDDEAAAMAVADIALQTLPPEAAASLIERLSALKPDDDAVLALKLEAMLRAGDAQPISDQQRWHTADPTVHRLRAEALARCGRRDTAIRVLGSVVGKIEGRHETKATLARIVGEAVLQAYPLRLRVRRPNRKIFNLVVINDEIELMRMRMQEMGPWVDQFVIVEARSTFTGQPKPLHFDAAKDQFAPWLRKISHIVIDAFPPEVDTAWAREFWQRDIAIRALDQLAAPQDMILLTDADEIVRREALDGYTGGVLALKMQTYRYFLNYGALPVAPPAQGKDNAHTAAVCTAEHLTRYGVSYTRAFQSRTGPIWDAIPHAGWHFTSLGDAAAVAAKFAAFAHQEHTEMRSQSKVEAKIAAIAAGQFEPGWGVLPMDALPRYVHDNAAALSDLLLPATSSAAGR